MSQEKKQNPPAAPDNNKELQALQKQMAEMSKVLESRDDAMMQAQEQIGKLADELRSVKKDRDRAVERVDEISLELQKTRVTNPDPKKKYERIEVLVRHSKLPKKSLTLKNVTLAEACDEFLKANYVTAEEHLNRAMGRAASENARNKLRENHGDLQKVIAKMDLSEALTKETLREEYGFDIYERPLAA